MFLYRLKQFGWSVTSRITKDDEEFLHHFLSATEKDLFDKLSLNERKHSIRVARSIKSTLSGHEYNLNEIGLSENDMIKASLLHDIGKTAVSVNIIEKSIIVILDKITSGKLKNMTHNKKVNCYYYHGAIGYEILKKYGYNEKFLTLIRDHHVRNSHGNKALEILKYSDNKN